jgi:DNA polymerase-3 subunit alpha
MTFVSLHTHTSIGSMLDSLLKVNDAFDKAKELGQTALGITDHGTLAAHHDAWKASQRTGVKFVPGCEVYFVNTYDPLLGEGKRKRNERRKHLVLLAQNEIGYHNLLVATYESFKRNEISAGRAYPRMSWDILEAHSEGLVCTSACGQGLVAEKLMLGDIDGAKAIASRLARIFQGRFFLEIQPHHLKVPQVDQELVNRGTIAIAREFDLPLVAAVDTHYLSKGFAKYKDMLAAIRWKRSLEDQLKDEGATIDEFYMKSGEEVYAFLVEHYGQTVADEAITNTTKIAMEMCEDPKYLKSTGNHLPLYRADQEHDYQEFLEWRQTKVSDSLDETAAFMRFRCFKSFLVRFAHLAPKEQMRRWERVKYEIKILEKNNFSSYMLVVADFINWAKNNGILVGCGRGSDGGCIIAHLLGIHNVDPFDYGLIFERFQNTEKKSLPDIDTDFASAGLDRVIEYVRQKYGYDKCAHVSNFNTYKPKNTISDLARSLRISDGQEGGKNYFQMAAAIKDSIPEKDENDKTVTTIEQALKLSKSFCNFAEQYPDLMEYAKIFIGLEQNWSTHAAGLIISDKPLVEFTPLRMDKDGQVAVQMEKNRCEEIGLVKMDFLGLATLDVIDETFRSIRKIGEQAPLKMEDIPLDDAETYEMISRGHTKGVFQLGKTSLMMALCRQIKPKNIMDIAVVNALVRPGSKLVDKETGRSERDEYIGRRRGEFPASYLHPSLKASLESTYGLCVFEEQLMGVAKDVAGWDLNKADGLRKLTKLKEKGKDLALKLEKEFVEGFVATHHEPAEKGQEIWDKIVAPCAGYMFNSSHAVFYSINSYYTAWLKRHHPASFLAALMKQETASNSITSDNELEAARQECKRLGIRIIPPDVNRSGTAYDVVDSKTVIMGLAAIKGLGEKAAQEIVSKQPYVSFVDFLYRTEARTVNKSKLEAMAKAGCFDSFGIPRRFAFEAGKDARERLKKIITKRQKDGYDVATIIGEFSLGISDEWDRKTLLENEITVLGQCLSGTINEIYGGFFTGIGTTPLARLKALPNRYEIVVEVLVKAATREFAIKKEGRNQGRKMAKYNVEDIEGTVTELTVWPDQYEMAKRRISAGVPIRAQCQISDWNGQKTLMLMKFQEIYGEKKAEENKDNWGAEV